jgi:sugar lactone lactonase YvrE
MRTRRGYLIKHDPRHITFALWRPALRVVCTALGALLVHAPIIGCAAAEPDATRAGLERVQALRKEHPGDGILVFYEAVLRSQLREKDAALDLLRSLKGRKLGLIPMRDIGFDAVWDNPAFQSIRKELVEEEPRTSDSRLAFRLKDPKLIPEGIAFDPIDRRFFIGSTAQKKIIVADMKGEARDFSSPSDKLDPILGLAVAGEYLYAVSTNGSDENHAELRNAVVRFDRKSGRLVDRFSAPEAMQLNDLAVGLDGTVYVTDLAGTLFRKKPNEKALVAFGTRGVLRGANGITLGVDGALYVAISTGIARVDINTGEQVKLSQPDTLVSGGIDGLYWYKGDLIGVQNAINPGRVVRLILADNGNRIDGLSVLQSSHHPDFDEPTTGSIVADALYVIGNSHVSHYQRGTITNPGDLKGTAIIAVPLERRD